MSSQEDPIVQAKRQAAFRAVDEFVRDGMKLGIGSGSTVVFVVERLAQLVADGTLNASTLVCVPTSFQSRALILDAGLTLGDLSQHPQLDVAIDGADEADAQLNLIKGGGGAQTREKIVASCARTFVVVADYRKKSRVLGEQWKQGVPIEVIPMAYVPVLKRIEALGGKPTLRMAKSKAGPVVTDNGNFIIDADFGVVEDPAALEGKLAPIPGVVETGLFIGMANKAFFGMKDGSVTELERTA